MQRDPRHYQIAVLTMLLAYGVWRLGFDVGPIQIAVTIAAAQLTQWACTKVWDLPRFDPKSALISSLSLCLLLRTDFAAVAALAAVLTIASKFAIRVDGRHVFNPTALGLVLMILLTERAWVSPAQWGSNAFMGFLIACLGGLVIHRSLRSDITLAMLGGYAALVLGRAVWLGDPLAIPLHHLQSGALLLFAFFMISDPKTTPASRLGRIVFGGAVAFGAWYVHFVMYEPNGFLWSLVVFTPLVPVLNRVLPGPVYEWPAAGGSQAAWKGTADESSENPAPGVGRPLAA